MTHYAAEDLLVRARRGELGEDEARRFEVAVRASRELQLLYEAGLEFDAQAELLAGDEQRMSSLVTGALQELERAEPPRAAVASRRRRSDAWFFATSVGLGMLLSVALASAWQLAERRLGGVTPSPAPVIAAKRRAEPVVAPSSPPSSASPIAELEPAPKPRRISSAAPPTSRVVEAASPSPSPSELFARANEARRSGAHEAAIAAYEELIGRYPDSIEAEDARVLVGNLRLSQRAPGAALGAFEQYGTGALSPEALWGRARALRSLRSPEERQVLERILQEYPDSPYASGARQRLEQL